VIVCLQSLKDYFFQTVKEILKNQVLDIEYIFSIIFHLFCTFSLLETYLIPTFNNLSTHNALYIFS